MNYKWNFSELQKYSNEYAKITTDNYFNNKDFITGDEILNLTKIKQLNLFALKELFDKWKDETSKLKSAYFDFEASEVKQSLADFLNVLSRYIKVSKEDFEPILAKATNNTLELYLDPAHFFSQTLRHLPDFKLEKSWLQDNGKFFKDYSWVLIELMQRINGFNNVYANEGIDWIHDIIKQDKIENHEEELLEIEKTIGSKFNTLEPSKAKSSFFDSIQSNDVSTNNVVPVVEKQTVSQEVAQPIIDIKPEFKVANPVENLTLNDALQKNNEAGSLSDFHQKRKIESIKGNISLNQKFLFINNLFDGEYESFNVALDELEVCQSFGEAKEQMVKKYLPKYKWNLGSAEVEEFFDLLKRRYN